MDTHVYNVDLNWSNDRQGKISSPELNQTVTVATPPEFPKGIEGIWSPEHLFTAAVSSCLMTTFLAVAEASKLEFKSFHCEAHGKLEKVDGKFLMTEVLLQPKLEIVHEKDVDRAQRILEKSEHICLISNSIKSTVIMETTIQIAQELSTV